MTHVLILDMSSGVEFENSPTYSVVNLYTLVSAFNSMIVRTARRPGGLLLTCCPAGEVHLEHSLHEAITPEHPSRSMLPHLRIHQIATLSRLPLGPSGQYVVFER
jgi:hypothetical protein